MAQAVRTPQNQLVEPESLRDKIERLSCHDCGATRADSLLVAIEAAENEYRLRAQCLRCHLLWMVSAGNDLRDLVSRREPRVRPEMGQISARELDEVHAILDRWQGPVEALFGEQPAA